MPVAPLNRSVSSDTVDVKIVWEPEGYGIKRDRSHLVLVGAHSVCIQTRQGGLGSAQGQHHAGAARGGVQGNEYPGRRLKIMKETMETPDEISSERRLASVAVGTGDRWLCPEQG